MHPKSLDTQLVLIKVCALCNTATTELPYWGKPRNLQSTGLDKILWENETITSCSKMKISWKTIFYDA